VIKIADPKKRRKDIPRKIEFAGRKVKPRTLIFFGIIWTILITIAYGYSLTAGGDDFVLFGIVPFPLAFALETFAVFIFPLIFIAYLVSRKG